MTVVDPTRIPAKAMHKILLGGIVPRPIAWTSTVDEAGSRNLAPFSYFTVVSTDPPMISITIESGENGREKDTLANIRATSQFAVNIVSVPLANQMWTTSGEHPPHVDEFELAGVSARSACRIAAPLVAEAPISLECVLDRIIRPGGDSVVIGRVVLCHLRADLLDERYHVDSSRFEPLGRVGGAFSPVERVVDLPDPTLSRTGPAWSSAR